MMMNLIIIEHLDIILRNYIFLCKKAYFPMLVELHTKNCYLNRNKKIDLFWLLLYLVQ